MTELSLSLNDSNATSQSLQERLQQMQRALTNSEHDRKIMAERLEALKAAQQDAKNRYNVQQDRMQQMQNEQADAEVNDCICDTSLVELIALGILGKAAANYSTAHQWVLTDC